MSLKIFAVLLLIFTPALTGKNGNLLSLIQVYRHGERSPVIFFPTDPYQDFSYWNTTPGQLTNTGKLQHFQLGQYTRSRYNSFIPKQYSNEDFLVQSTNTDRTFMSAASNVAGLYPPVGYQVWKQGLQWQPIPVFPVNEAVLGTWSNCNAYITAMQQVFSADELFLSVLQENQELFAYLSENTGTNVTSIFDVLMIWDTLYIEYLRNYTLPAWTQSIFPDPVRKVAWYYYLASSYTEELKIVTSGPFFNAVIEQFEAILANSTVQPHLQFSCHDINLFCILNSMGLLQQVVPGFASTIYFELRQRRGRNYVNIYYSNFAGVEPVPLTLPGCGFDCDLQDFKNILANRTITPQEWKLLCNA